MLQTLKNKSKRIASTLAAGVLFFSQFAVVPSVGATSTFVDYSNGTDKIDICHANNGSKGYSSTPVNENSIANLEWNGHGWHWNDIIPTFKYIDQEWHGWPDFESVNVEKTYDGRNWDPQGQEIWNNGCNDSTSVKVKKVVVGAADAGKFNLKVNGNTEKSNAQNGQDTGKVSISSHDDLTVSETAGTGSSLSNYTTTIVCTDQNGTGSPAVIKQGNSTSLTIDKNDVKRGDDILCVITNTGKYGSLKVVKDVVNDNGNTKKYSNFHYTKNDSSFTLDADATDAQGFDGVKTFTGLTPGQYTIVETDANTMGYTTSYTVGDTTNGTSCVVTVVAGQEAVCTITNDDQDPLLTLQKVVIKDNGGTAHASDWTLTAQDGANTPVINAIPSVVSVDTTTNSTAATVATDVAPGSYTLSETGGPSGYAASSWSCDGGTLVGNTVTVTYGDHVTCTITNDDIAPLLTVNKNVFNDNGGTANPNDFNLTVGGLPILSGVQTPWSAGTFAVGEEQQDGYKFLGFGGACDSLGVITLALGGVYTCNLTNDDQPAKITVKKVVINNNGGHAKTKDFTLKVNGTVVKSDETNEFNGNLQVYVHEQGGPKGYEATHKQCWDVTNPYNWNAVGTYFKTKLGHEYFCKIVNDDKAPKLKIVKDARPDSIQPFSFTLDQKKYGNWHEKSNFQLNDNHTHHPLDNDKTFYLDAGWYKVTEGATDGWYLDGIVCHGTHEYVDLESGKVVVNLEIGDEVTCVFTNNKYGKVKGFKFEDVNKNGHWNQGEPTLSGWTITLDKLYSDDEIMTTVTGENGWYEFDGLKAGWYKVCEVQQKGWVQTTPVHHDGCEFVWLKPGDTGFVKFGNFELGKITGVKFNDINGNGKRDDGEPGLKDWTIKLTNKCEVIDVRTPAVAQQKICKEETKTATTDATGAYSFTGLEAGEYLVCEEQQTNWTQTFPSDNNGCHTVTIEGAESGEVVTADFGNKAKPQVLGETTTQQLVNTGASAVVSTAFGLVILSVLATLHFLARRKNYQN